MDEQKYASVPHTIQRDGLDDIDRQLVSLLAADGRMTNAELAASVGVAPSTALMRVRSLIARRVVSGFHASVDQRLLGRGLHAVIGVTLIPGARRDRIAAFTANVRTLPQVIQVFFLGGNDDFLVHIAVRDSSEVREFVLENLSAQPTVGSTRTSIIFDYHRNSVSANFK